MAARPQFLLLDEPGAGLNEAESDYLIGALRVIQLSFSLGLLVIEHDMKVIMNVCDRIQVLDHGKTIAVGTPDAVRANPEVITGYLGSGRSEHA
jgi:branched-chain amino acid transport system ATP-binding protein